MNEDSPGFWFATCQVGAERALKAELAHRWPAFRLAFSRPGFLTFKVDAATLPSLGSHEVFDAGSVFARARGWTIGKVAGENVEERARQAKKLLEGEQFDVLHVWQRDLAPAGYRGFEPGIHAAALEARAALYATLEGIVPTADVPSIASPGQRVLDCVLVDEDQWWLGVHRAASIASRYPGGFCPVELPPHTISRAYAKAVESLAWSELPFRAGETIAEIGCAPGGSCQAWLDRGMKVIGIDPALVDSRVAEHPNFRQIRKRGAEVRRREFAGVRWLAADINVAPQFTLDVVEGIVTHADVHIEGLLLTLKLLEWKLADEIPAYLERIASWGFPHPRARQLASNRQEICVAAQRPRHIQTARKSSRQRSTPE